MRRSMWHCIRMIDEKPMNPVKTIDVQDWMKAPQTQAVLAALDPDGQGMQALFVGGCVRNALLGEAVDDIDIATPLIPEEGTKRLTAAGIKVIPTGIEHGTITAVTDGRTFEITTLRKDIETFGRHAVVAYTEDWCEDAPRRDFTMNTLLADAGGHIYDPTGQGLADLTARRVVFVGDPATRIAEDYLRILRFFRFQAYYGRGAPDEAALTACRAATNHIGDLSKERISRELLKILSVDNPADILYIMFENNILNKISNARDKEGVLRCLTELQNKYDAFHITPRLFIFQSVDKAGLVGVSPLMNLSNDQKKELQVLLEVQAGLEENGESATTVKALIYHHGAPLTEQGLLLNAARQGTGVADEWIALTKGWAVPVFPLRGADLLAAGVSPGPHVGKILAAVENWWIEQDFAPDHAACLEKARGLIG